MEILGLKQSCNGTIWDGSAAGAGIAGRRRRVVLLRGRAEQLGEDGLQGIRPDLVALERGMQLVAIVHHAVEQLAIPIRQFVVDVQIPDPLAVGKFGQIVVDLVDRRHHRHVVVAREDARDDDGGVGSLCLHDVQDRLKAPGDIRDLVVIAPGGRGIADVIGAGEQDDDLRIDSVQLSIVEAPEDVLSGVGAPSEVGRVPAEEVLLPVGQQFRIVGSSPAAGDGVALEIDVDAAFLGLLQQLGMSGEGVLVGSRATG